MIFAASPPFLLCIAVGGALVGKQLRVFSLQLCCLSASHAFAAFVYTTSCSLMFLLFRCSSAVASSAIELVEQTGPLCSLKVWFGHLGFVVAFGAMFAKTYRLHRVSLFLHQFFSLDYSF